MTEKLPGYDHWKLTTPEDDEYIPPPPKLPPSLHRQEYGSMVVNGVRRYEEDYIYDPLRDWD